MKTMEVGDLIRRTLKPLLDERENVDRSITDLEGQLAELKTVRRQLGKLLRDGGLIEPEAKSNGNGRKPKRIEPKPSEEMLDRARDFLPDGEFTVKQGAAAMGVAELTARRTIEALRDLREVRLVGVKVPEGAKSSMKAAHFARV